MCRLDAPEPDRRESNVTQITMHFLNYRMSWLMALRMQTYRYEQACMR
jgi:hypothetical protein